MEYQVMAFQHLFEAAKHFDQCHASNIVILENKELLCSWFAGSREGADDVDIWLAKTREGVWGEPSRVASYNDGPCWNPVLLVLNDRVVLYYKVGRSIPTWRTLFEVSFDQGDTWSEANELVGGDTGGRGPVKNKCITLSSGRILAPASLENGPNWSCFVDLSDDNAVTWLSSQAVPADYSGFLGSGLIQPTLWEDSHGIVHMYMRSSEGFIYSSQSEDEGMTWTAARRTSLPNNNCGIDVCRLDDGRLVLIYNPISGNWGARSPISFSVSDDNGVSWSAPVILEHVPCDANIERAEFSYPSIIADGDDVHLTYTWKRKSISYWHLRFQPSRNSKPVGRVLENDTNSILQARNWVTMITPFDHDGEVDYDAVERLVEWYISHEVDGIFAVCQSSEMFFLSLEERVELATFVLRIVAGRVPVVISGHISDHKADQMLELNALAEVPAQALVLVTNRLAGQDESDEVWKANMLEIMEAFPKTTFGLYECPYPYKRLLSPELLSWCAATDRFTFLKDTSCDLTAIREKLAAVQGSRMQIYNANAATLLESLRLGVSGYSGVMNNFWPELFAHLIERRQEDRQIAELLQSVLTTTALIELKAYPINAKYALARRGVAMELNSRSNLIEWHALHEAETDAVLTLMGDVHRRLLKL